MLDDMDSLGVTTRAIMNKNRFTRLPEEPQLNVYPNLKFKITFLVIHRILNYVEILPECYISREQADDQHLRLVENKSDADMAAQCHKGNHKMEIFLHFGS
ncbi:hypothetical protein AVEN_136144-1 [Araneus ventricosus]|uniref:Uncharacterized protein n=1 Tax=Araneus ventricosus TaxID=182803 RepID=A0A4Y2WAY5_ARAVE|nr:hypothetical protein AVEN_136144-1 [Araneus ventricosus]